MTVTAAVPAPAVPAPAVPAPAVPAPAVPAPAVPSADGSGAAAARALVQDYLETLWNQGRTDLADRYLAEGLIRHNPDLPDGRAPLTAFVDGLRAQLPELRFELRRLAAEVRRAI
ncbi:ester cyclase [Kitasatospora sp. NPDC057015]|uniref:nuclear transport factor 2 family protein n=1 Tax=Kitasatospora sp. NPDC057015 TaxID=3346001 RepID=UPI00362F5023